jgi:molybdate transport system ATP-binding protein
MALAATIQLQLGELDLDVALAAGPGQVTALLGPNGSGKTTVLRCLAGLAPIDGGHIELDGEVLDDPTAGRFVNPEHRAVGFVFQSYLLFDHMTVLENVAYGLRARGRSRAEARRAAAGWLARVGLDGYAGDRPRSLSGGQAQRAALARALVLDPRLLLLDEPLAALDATTRSVVRRELRAHLDRFEGIPVLVTHDPVDAYALADRVVILEEGRVRQAGTLAEVTAHPRSRYVADLIGVNLVAGLVADGVLTTAAGARVVIAEAASGPSLAVIKPHSVVLVRDPVAGSSARNLWPGTVADLDRLGDRVRVSLDGPLPLAAEITAAALEALGLRPGEAIHASVKATDIDVFPA